jgi:hypothetical protein
MRHVVALRIKAVAAVAAIDGSTRIDGIVGASVPGTAAVTGVDPIRRIGRIRVPNSSAPPIPRVSLDSLPTPLYVVVVEGTQAGVTLRPLFLGRSDRYGSSRSSPVATRPIILITKYCARLALTMRRMSFSRRMSGGRAVIQRLTWRVRQRKHCGPVAFAVASQHLYRSDYSMRPAG